MSDYYFYRYKFTNVPAEPVIGQEEEKGTPREILNRRLEDKLLPVSHKKSSGETNRYNNVIFYHDGVALMRLQNSTMVSIHREDFSTDSEPSFPFVDIVIDNREGHQLIAIEKNGSFKKQKGDNNTTQRVARLMAESINEYLRRYGRAIEIAPIARKQKLWSAMINRVTNEKARVRSIEFLFPTDDDKGVQKSNALTMLTQLSRKNGAEDAAFRLNYRNGDMTELAKAQEDFKAMEMFASRQNYQLNVKFNDMSIIRSGTMLYAHYELLDRDISNFIAGAPGFGKDGNGEFLLNSFIDDLHKTLKDYENDK